MDNSVDQQRLADYQKRVADWISNQGILFQLRHATTIGSSNIGRKLGGLLVSLLVIALIALAISYGFLLRHFKSGSYRMALAEEVQSGLKAEEMDLSGFERDSGRVTFRYLNLTGGEESFFSDADFQIFSGPVSLLSGVSEKWQPKNISIKKAEVELKAGGEDMSKAFKGLIDSMNGNGPKLIQIAEASFDWGYSSLAYGRIEGTAVEANLHDGQWEIDLRGGTFRQNWLKDFQITRGELIISQSGLEIKTLELLKGEEGTMTLSGKVGGTLEVPEFQLSGGFTNIPLESLIEISGIRIRDYLSGTISGTLEITGSTDRHIVIKGEATLGEGDMMVVREQWEILNTFTVLDHLRNFRRINFTKGGFRFETSKGELSVSDLQLESLEKDKKHVNLSGGFETRLPGQKEAADAIGIILTDGFSQGFSTDPTDSSAAQALEDERISLTEAVKGGAKVNDFGISVLDENDKSGASAFANLSTSEIDALRLKTEMNVYRIEGDLTFLLPEDVFQAYPRLETSYNVVEEGRRQVPINLKGNFSNVTDAAAKKLRDDSREKSATELDVSGS